MSPRSFIFLLTLAITLGLADTALATWTGCVTPGGTVVHLAPGIDPARPCTGKQRLIHLDDYNNTQNPDAKYDQAIICKAFHDLALSPDRLEELGCHHEPDNFIPGDLRTVPLCTLGDPAGCVFQPPEYSICDGAFKIEEVELGTGYDWVLPGGFQVSSFAFDIINDSDRCRATCEADPECLAAHATFESVGTERATCVTYHKSEGITTPYTEYCGPLIELCTTSLDREKWWLRCENPLP